MTSFSTQNHHQLFRPRFALRREAQESRPTVGNMRGLNEGKEKKADKSRKAENERDDTLSFEVLSMKQIRLLFANYFASNGLKHAILSNVIPQVDATEIRCSSAPPGSAGKERGGLSDGEGTDLEEPLLFQEYAGPAFGEHFFLVAEA